MTMEIDIRDIRQYIGVVAGSNERGFEARERYVVLAVESVDAVYAIRPM